MYFHVFEGRNLGYVWLAKYKKGTVFIYIYVSHEIEMYTGKKFHVLRCSNKKVL